MTKALYLDNMNLNEFNATVEAVSKEKYIILDQTAFYPKSGGVSYDTGTFIRESDNKSFNVIYTGKFKGKLSHEVDKIGLQKGDEIKGKLNWDRRYLLMRYHTAAHILSGVFYNKSDAKITGNDLDTNKGRMDFNIETFDRELIASMVEEANKIVQENYPVKIYYMDREEVNKHEDLVKLAMGIPNKIKKIRIVDIEGFDRQPDGGCHVSSTKEVGNIILGKIKNKGKNNRRMYYTLNT